MTDIKLNLDELLQQNRLIAHVWSTEDIKNVRPDLDDDQAWAVLQHVAGTLDSTVGIDWDTIEQAADDLYGLSNTDE